MKTIQDFIDYAIMLYPNKPLDIVDCNNKFCYISKELAHLFNLQTETLQRLEDLPPHQFSKINTINLAVTKKIKPCKVLVKCKTYNEKHQLIRIIKYPLINDDNEILGIMSIINLVKSIQIEPKHSPQLKEIVFDLDNNDLNDLDKLILFYASIGFTQSEIYQAIINLGKNYSMNGFKYYYNQLLIKTKASSIKQILTSDSHLNERTFIPKSLVELNHQQILL